MSAPASATSAIVGLRRWARGHSPQVAAAVGLLIAHGTWPARQEFRDACIERDRDGTCWIDWTDVREAFDAGAFMKASTSEIAVLDLAIALGEDRFRFSRMGPANARAIADVIAAAVGVTR
ncbi:hypothetical protein Psed_0030 [Pseudonocardia dioxanivorans CB1190]|uniref:Uncharacterized protein n=1 Tax=Pseudonocardia dioxanivorans (strain ATCC 55486 / DSM 44775 / JCM 13855 / CB1190) TaxID=675635 RepID=F4CK89_PSEUX|nr:hypothetical protein [Pseudonocardia dioxanivorans]AEA22312.1 hypothetical protein Psed_0030 [Pseudonocardia dioxanivorans CB1190]